MDVNFYFMFDLVYMYIPSRNIGSKNVKFICVADRILQGVEPFEDQRRSGTRSKMDATARPDGGGQIWQQLGMTTHGGQP